MRIWKELLGASAAFAIAIVLTPAAEAQSVFQKIFGFAGPAQPAPPANRQIIPPQRFQSHGGFHARVDRAQRDQQDDDEIGPPDSAGPYRTVCVRTCDGFYFPLRHNATRKNFASDVKSCRNACGSDARLYYYSLNGPEGPDAMVDLGGKKYMDLPHALAYRKALLSGCTCKAVPWSSEEAARHQGYADKEAVELAKDEAFQKARAEAAANEITANSTTDDEADASTTANANAPEPDAKKETAQVKEPLAAAPRAPRRAKTNVERVRYKPASAPTLFGFGNKQYVWPGDAR